MTRGSPVSSIPDVFQGLRAEKLGELGEVEAAGRHRGAGGIDRAWGEVRFFVERPMADRLLAAKQRDAAVDMSALERELDELVDGLYGLTPEEIKIVEESAKK